MAGFLDALLAGVKNVAQAGSVVALPQNVQGPVSLNFASGATVAYNPSTRQMDVTVSGGGGQSQFTTTVGNGLNSNVPTNGLSSLLLGGPTGAFSIGGFQMAGGATPGPGQILSIQNTTTQNLTIVNEDVGSTAKNRISTPGGTTVLLPPGSKSTAFFFYNATTQRWVMHSVGASRPLYINVKDFGATGDGATDDTAAIQEALSYFAGRTSLTSGTIFFPFGIYKITSPLSFTGNGGISLRMVGEGAGQQFGPTIAWFGSAGGTMLNTFGLTCSEIDNLIFNACGQGSSISPAACCLWLHTDQPGGGSGSFNVFVRRCTFVAAEGAGRPDLGTASSLVNIGDFGSNQEVQSIYFDFCQFYGNLTSFPNHVPFANVQNMQQGTGNTEQFFFRGCAFSGAQICFYDQGGNSPVSFTDGCEWAQYTFAALYVNGAAEVSIRNCYTEGANSPAHTGLFIVSGALTNITLDSCVITIDSWLNNTLSAPAGVSFGFSPVSGAIMCLGGQSEIVNTVLDGTLDVTSPSSITTVMMAGFDQSVSIRRCTTLDIQSVGQLTVTDLVGNKISNSDFSQGTKWPLFLEGNRDNFNAGSPMFPDFCGQSETVNNLGSFFSPSQTVAPYFQKQPLFRAEQRDAATCYEIDFTDAQFKQSGSVLTWVLTQYFSKSYLVRSFVDVTVPFISSSSAGASVVADFGTPTGAIVDRSDIFSAIDVHTSATQYINNSPSSAIQWSGNAYITATFKLGNNQSFGNGSRTWLSQGQARVYIIVEHLG